MTHVGEVTFCAEALKAARCAETGRKAPDLQKFKSLALEDRCLQAGAH